MGNFSYVYTGDLENFLQLLNPTEAQVNTYFKVEVHYNGAKMADLSYQDNSGEFEVMITYKDGTVENSENYYNDFLDDVEAEVLEYTGAWGF